MCHKRLNMTKSKNTTVFVILSLLCFMVGAHAKDTINFAPLPMKNATKNIQDFVPINSYLKQKLNININYVYKNNYQDILDSFVNGDIDIAYLGPLPLVSLHQKYPYLKPIITFNQKNGSEKYRCVLTKFKKDKFDITKKFKVALTQPLSTCGYFMTQKLLKDNFGIELKNQYYDYTMSHSNAILGSLSGEFLIAGAKDSIAKKYNSIGIEIIAQSEYLPGFTLVANTKTLTFKQITQIQDILLDIPSKVYKSWKGISSKGFVKASINDYDVIDVDFKKIPLKGNMK